MSRDPRAPFWRRWSRPLRLHLSIVIVILLMLIAGPLMWLSHEQGVRLSTAAATQQMRLLGRRAAERYETVLGDGFSAASTLAAALAFRSGVPDDLDAKTRLLRAALNGSSFIDSVYAGYPDGSFIQLVGVAGNPDWAKAMSMPDGTAYALRVLQATPEGSQVVWHYLDRDWVLIADRPSAPTNYDPRRRPWYRDAVRGTEPVAVGPYVMATTKTLGITVAAPMGDDSEVVVGADVMIETLGRLLSREAVSASAVGYVFDAQGRLVIHSDPRQMERLTHLLLSSGRAGDEALDDLVLNQVRVVLAGEGRPKTRRPSASPARPISLRSRVSSAAGWAAAKPS
jgi:adenylate cyclase